MNRSNPRKSRPIKTKFLDEIKIKKLKNSLKMFGTSEKKFENYLMLTYRIINNLESMVERRGNLQPLDKEYVMTIEFARIVSEIVAKNILDSMCPKKSLEINDMTERLLNGLSEIDGNASENKNVGKIQNIRYGVANAIVEILTMAKRGTLPTKTKTVYANFNVKQVKRGKVDGTPGKGKLTYCETRNLVHHHNSPVANKPLATPAISRITRRNNVQTVKRNTINRDTSTNENRMGKKVSKTKTGIESNTWKKRVNTRPAVNSLLKNRTDNTRVERTNANKSVSNREPSAKDKSKIPTNETRNNNSTKFQDRKPRTGGDEKENENARPLRKTVNENQTKAERSTADVNSKTIDRANSKGTGGNLVGKSKGPVGTLAAKSKGPGGTLVAKKNIANENLSVQNDGNTGNDVKTMRSKRQKGVVGGKPDEKPRGGERADQRPRTDEKRVVTVRTEKTADRDRQEVEKSRDPGSKLGGNNAKSEEDGDGVGQRNGEKVQRRTPVDGNAPDAGKRKNDKTDERKPAMKKSIDGPDSRGRKPEGELKDGRWKKPDKPRGGTGVVDDNGTRDDGTGGETSRSGGGKGKTSDSRGRKPEGELKDGRWKQPDKPRGGTGVVDDNGTRDDGTGGETSRSGGGKGKTSDSRSRKPEGELKDGRWKKPGKPRGKKGVVDDNGTHDDGTGGETSRSGGGNEKASDSRGRKSKGELKGGRSKKPDRLQSDKDVVEDNVARDDKNGGENSRSGGEKEKTSAKGRSDSRGRKPTGGRSKSADRKNVTRGGAADDDKTIDADNVGNDDKQVTDAKTTVGENVAENGLYDKRTDDGTTGAGPFETSARSTSHKAESADDRCKTATDGNGCWITRSPKDRRRIYQAQRKGSRYEVTFLTNAEYCKNKNKD